MNALVFEVPIKTISASNAREHWAVKAKRVKDERARTSMCFRVALRRAEIQPRPVLSVSLTRYGRRLDDDNLRGALKAIRDAVAAELGVDDGSSLVEWRYQQALAEGEPRVEVRIEKFDDCPEIFEAAR